MRARIVWLTAAERTTQALARYDYQQHNCVIRDVPVAPSRFGDVADDAFSIRIRQRNALSEPESRLSPVRSSADPRALTGKGRARKGDQLYEVKG